MTAAELAAALLSSDVERRRDVLANLGEVRDSALGWQVLGALGDRDWRVREEAVRIVAEIAMPCELMHGLVDCLAQGMNVGLRNAAREVFTKLGSTAAPTLLAALFEVEAPARKFVVEAMTCAGESAAVDALIRVAGGPDAMVAVGAMDALAQLGSERATETLRKQLGATDAFVRIAAIDALTRLDVQLPWSDLAPLIEDRVLRRVAMDALGRCGDMRALPHLASALSEKSQHLVARALLGLQRFLSADAAARLGAKGALAQVPGATLARLRTFAAHEDPAVALAACMVLAYAGRTEAVPAAIEVLARGGSVTQLSAALAELREAGVLALLQFASQDAAEPALAFELLSELAALEVLAPSHIASVRTLLRSTLGTADAELVQTTLRAFGRFAEARDAAELLVHACADDLERASVACQALFELAGRDAASVRDALATTQLDSCAAPALAELMVEVSVHDVLERLRTALLSEESSERVAALSGLARLGGSDAAELARLALVDDDSDVRNAALDALARMPNATAFATDALNAFETEDADAQTALACALAVRADKRSEARLRKLTRARAPGARLYALRALIGMRAASLDETLFDALSDADSEVVKQALQGLGENGGLQAVARITLALEHSAWDVRRLAADWLKRLHAASAVPALRARLSTESDAYARSAIDEALAELGGVS